MAKVITFSIQKGGAGKTTSSSITAYLLSQHYRVLAVDLDSQGNMTYMISQRHVKNFRGRGALDAIAKGDPREYILALTDSLHLLPGSSQMVNFEHWLWTEYKGNRSLVVKRMLDVVADNYDYIILDTPPALGSTLVSSFVASDGIIAMFETGQFCFDSLDDFEDLLNRVRRETNRDIMWLGLLPTMVDKRSAYKKEFEQMIRDRYGDLVFPTCIKTSAPIGRLAYRGFLKNPEVTKAVEQYIPFVEEMLTRVK